MYAVFEILLNVSSGKDWVEAVHRTTQKRNLKIFSAPWIKPNSETNQATETPQDVTTEQAEVLMPTAVKTPQQATATSQDVTTEQADVLTPTTVKIPHQATPTAVKTPQQVSPNAPQQASATVGELNAVETK